MSSQDRRNDCLFCKIADRQIPAHIIYEDKDVMAFLDINPVNSGHALVLPKKHANSLLDMDDLMICSVFKAVRDISEKVMKAMNAQGFNIMINNYRAAGQLIDHAHIHIIPRFEGDGLKHWPGKKLPEQEMEKIAEKIRTAVA